MIEPTPPASENLWVRICNRLAAHPCLALTLAVFGALMPFLAKPFNIDDPLFLWAAHQIHAHPFDPYGFNVEWGWREFPMWKVTENPPLDCYFIALAAAVLGWSEIALHAAFLLPVIAVILGTHRLAKLFCGRPVLAALITLFMPVFLVSSTTVMCDVPMLACWVWTVALWVEGTDKDNLGKLFFAALLVAVAEMTKYYGACLIPLLAAYSLAARQPVKRWGQFLLVPLAVLCAYQYATQAAYGYSLLYRATDYATFSQGFLGASKLRGGLTALAFTGGCMAPVFFFAPAWMRRRGLILAIAALALVALLIFPGFILWENHGALAGASLPAVKIQMTIWAAAGLGVLGLALGDLFRRRDARSLLLALWVAGTFWFAAFCNWTVNARSILPLTPAVAILIVRRLETQNPARPRAAGFGLAASALLALLVARSDFLQATAVRESAVRVLNEFKDAPGTIWFQGHWGFQFYMEAGGAKAVDFKSPQLRPGDLVVVPRNNTNLMPLDPAHATWLRTLQVPGPRRLATWNPDVGAGFYAAVFGPLPFAFGAVSPEEVAVYELLPVDRTSPAGAK